MSPCADNAIIRWRFPSSNIPWRVAIRTARWSTVGVPNRTIYHMKCTYSTCIIRSNTASPSAQANLCVQLLVLLATSSDLCRHLSGSARRRLPSSRDCLAIVLASYAGCADSFWGSHPGRLRMAHPPGVVRRVIPQGLPSRNSPGAGPRCRSYRAHAGGVYLVGRPGRFRGR
jgi:hypothetical protein